MLFCSYFISWFLLRDQWVNDWSKDWAKQWARLWLAQLLANSIKNFISREKQIDSALTYIYKALKTFVTLELSQYRKSGSTLSSSEPVAAHRDCSRLGNALCLCSPVRPPKLYLSVAPRAWPLNLQSKPSIIFWNSLRDSGVIARWPAGAWTWTQTWTLQPDQWVVMVLSALKL